MSIPVDITFHPGWWHKHAGVNFHKNFFFDADYRVEADVKMRKVLYDKFGDLGIGERNPEPRPILGSDLIASGFLYSEIVGCEVRYSDANPPEVICRNMTEDEVAKLQVPKLEEVVVWCRTLDQMEKLVKRFGYVDTAINLMGIQNIALDLRGSELFIDYYENPELAHHLLSACTELSVALGREFRKFSKKVSAGVTAIVKQTVPEVYLTSNCTVEMVSEEVYEEFLLPYDNLLAEEFSPFGIHHCGKTMEHVVDGYAKVKNLAFAEVGAFSDMARVRSALPGVYLNARYSPVRLKDAGFEAMRDEITDLLVKGSPLNLLSVSCVGIDSETSDNKVRDFIMACKEAERIVERRLGCNFTNF